MQDPQLFDLETRPNPTLPLAETKRWQPLRSGLENIYRFDHEEFHWEKGRMLLRGNNGTGKSRVMALQLPFLLDGEIAPYRVEPDGDPAKKIEWNLLLNTYQDRTGYTWIEFGHLDESGTAHYLTLGVGMSATQGKGLTHKWFFMTRQRIGRDLFLQNKHGEPLTRPRLTELIGQAGRVFSTAAKYREAVDEKLFGLGIRRYEALVNLLIQLRQPQLSRKLDEKKLSQALSDALPPLSESILGDVAESFRSLEQDEHELRSLEKAREGVEVFLGKYLRYAQLAALRRAEALRKTHSAYEEIQRKLKAAEAAVDEARAQHQFIQTEKQNLQVALKGADQRIRTLEAAPEMKELRHLDAAREKVRERHGAAERAMQDLGRAADTRQRRLQQQHTARTREASSRSAAERAVEQAFSAAAKLGIDRPHQAIMDSFGLPEPADLHAVDAGETRFTDLAESRLRAARTLRKLNAVLLQAENELTVARQAVNSLEDRMTEATEQRKKAHRELEQAAQTLWDAYKAWWENLVVLDPRPLSEIEEEWFDWAKTDEGENPALVAMEAAFQGSAAELAHQTAQCTQKLADAHTRLQGLQYECDHLKKHRHLPPVAPPTRDPAIRQELPGAPLWFLCDFVPEVTPQDRAGIEAAMEAAGILDAWVLPDGTLLDEGLHDTIITIDSPPLDEGTTLSRVLTPARDFHDDRAGWVSESLIKEILDRIGLGGGAHVWVDPSGRWRNGPLTGCWSKGEAEHIGWSAREQRLLRRLAELAEEIDAQQRTVAALERERKTIDTRVRDSRLDRDGFPDDRPVKRAHAHISLSEQQVALVRDKLAQAEKEAEHARENMRNARDDRNRSAEDMGLRNWCDQVDELFECISRYRVMLAQLLPALRVQISARMDTRNAAEALRLAVEEERQRQALAVEARKSEEMAVSERDTLEETHGAAIEEILDRLQTAREDHARLTEDLDQAITSEMEFHGKCEAAATDRENLKERLADQFQVRLEAVDRLGRFVNTRLLGFILPQFPEHDPCSWAVSQAVELARRIDEAIPDLAYDDETWNRQANKVMNDIETLKDDLLPHHFRPNPLNTDGIFTITVEFHGKERTIEAFRACLLDDIQHRRELLDAREREVIENHLIDDVANHLHDRIRGALDLVHNMNKEIRDRPMSTGMTLRFTWAAEEEGPAGLAEALRRLMAAGATWSAEDREALGEFLQRHIKRVRAEHAGTWLENLTLALDYRDWHRFSVERRQDGVWKRLTRKTHGTGSGGEKAIALTIPQFAAAAAHYRSAAKTAPRLILLDEAFVGVDSDMRSKCMGLLRAFDLDFMMTSEREWGCYPTLPGIAIFQLATRPGFDAVGISRWVWNGKERVLENPVFSPATPPHEIPLAVQEDP